jgi:glyoxylase-like metal-dependent hydrolase (beta-lactamase superfamily II)
LNERCGCASYVVASRRTHEGAIIDPAIETGPFEALLRERGLRLQYVIDTHIHTDHVSGARLVAAQYGGQLCLHESAQVAYKFHPLRDHEELELLEPWPPLSIGITTKTNTPTLRWGGMTQLEAPWSAEQGALVFSG